MNAIELEQKWLHKVTPNWYGFAVEGIADDWAVKIDDYLTWLEKVRPQFEIHQIKVKFGGLRVYLDFKMGEGDEPIHDHILTEINMRARELNKLWDKKLMY